MLFKLLLNLFFLIKCQVQIFSGTKIEFGRTQIAGTSIFIRDLLREGFKESLELFVENDLEPFSCRAGIKLALTVAVSMFTARFALILQTFR